MKLREGDVARGVQITPRVGRLKFCEMAADGVQDYAIEERQTAGDLSSRFRKHLLAFFGNSRAANISTVDIRRFIDKCQKDDAKNAEINRELAALKRSFNLAIQAGKLYAKPPHSDASAEQGQAGLL